MTSLFLGKDASGDAPLRVPPERLRTHGIIVGMTGSGKTGLALVLLEELLRAGIPIIAIDPKGDLGSLGLLFPQLDGPAFAPWVTEGDPAAVAARWRQGLDGWGIDAGQVGELRARLDLVVYTPGSTAGVPVDVVGSFAAPDPETVDDETRTALAADTVSGLMGLVGQEADPLRDPAHVVLAQIIERHWAAGRDVTLESLVLELVDPPFEKVGVFPLDRFFPPDRRMDLALRLNGVIASPSFAPWTRGVDLDVDALLASREGRVPVSLFSVAHLSESERQFFISLLLSKLLAWSRRQPGTEALRAVLFFDEVAGFLPPYPKSPPVKAPLMTIMKQARAVGLGVLLATQNPVDLDYKALSNAGLWCIGRLNTSQDRQRLLRGLEGDDLDERVARLDKREFLLVQTGKAAPQVFRTRHAMCYLRGPFTGVDLGRLNELYGGDRDLVQSPRTQEGPASAPVSVAVADDGLLPVPPAVPRLPSWFLDPRVVFSARFDDAFAPHAQPRREDGVIVYAPALWIDVALRFDEERHGFVVDRHFRRVWFPLTPNLSEDPLDVRLEPADLSDRPAEPARFHPLPEWLDERREFTQLKKRILDKIYREEGEGQFVNKPLKLYGRQGESREAFAGRCREVVEERIATKLGKLRDGYEKRIDRIEDRIRRKERQLAEQKGLLRSRQLEEAVSFGQTVWSLFQGRRRSLTTAIGKRRQTSQVSRRIDRLAEEIDELTAQGRALQEDLADEVERIRAAEEALVDEIEERLVRLERNDIRVEAFGLLWLPLSRRI